MCIEICIYIHNIYRLIDDFDFDTAFCRSKFGRWRIDTCI